MRSRSAPTCWRAWVREPTEYRRRTALSAGLGGNHAFAGTWLSLAAGGSGGTFMIDGQGGPPVPRDMTAKAVRAATLISLARLPIDDRAAKLVACVDICRNPDLEPDAEADARTG